ncbi:KptA family-domain-containing protein [Coprinopsis sp. MPI-PUGE-AT-0042]|nr:KptA family-domain-containing protein [Coprinopsis sp. MPI-PUGE-AT-0042]
MDAEQDFTIGSRGGGGKGGGKGKDKGKRGGGGKGGAKLRGLEKDSPDVRISKTLSWLLRHGATGEGLPMRKDGYVKVDDLLEHPKLKAVSLNFGNIQDIVKADAKKRYDLRYEFTSASTSSSSSSDTPAPLAAFSESGELNQPSADGAWWIKANQGHSIKTVVELNLKPITSVDDIPTGIAVHGTDKNAWKSIEKQGLSKMKRNHIHLAQGVAGQNVISGMRKGSQILIYINVQKALDTGIQFSLSDNGVVLTEGDSKGFLKPEFFARVEDAKRDPLPGWEGDGPVVAKEVDESTPRKPAGGHREGSVDTPTAQTPTPGKEPSSIEALNIS